MEMSKFQSSFVTVLAVSILVKINLIDVESICKIHPL